MEPVYMNMQSYPQQNGQIPFRPRCYPGMEARPPVSYESWPWGGNYGYVSPAGACHGCCNHGYMAPPFAWGSPYSHVPPHHYPGNYPYIPVQYMPPPPYPVMDHPRYEYEKTVPMEHHCCGCRNHPLHQKEQRNLRIEEEEPEKEKKNDSVVPSQFKNSPYPIVWLSPDYNESGKVKSTEVGKDAPRDVKEHDNGKSVEQQPTFRNGWLPLDLNNMVSSKGRGDGKENSHQDDGKRNSQFPLFWMPYKPDNKERENPKLKYVDEKPSLESEKGSGGDQNFDGNRGNTGDQPSPRVKSIPVKEVKEHVGKESSVNQEKEGGISVNDRNDEKKIDNAERLSPVEGSKKKSPTTPKSSKLPPVCLRVDPLPRKKYSNAKSRSPSPPGDKKKLEMKSNEAVKVRSSDNEEQVKEGMDKKKKTIVVVNGNTLPEKSMKVNVETPGNSPAKSQDIVSTKQAQEKPEEEIAQKLSETDEVIEGQSEDIVPAGGEKEESCSGEDVKTDSVKKCSKRELSEEEAAVIIQSAYRGLDVRRWQPIERLKEITRVREQMADVKRLIQEMELSSDMQGRAKQKNVIAETIMSLLLRLDTIQGLHPSIREVRKSAVRELVCLQEQLDTIMNENPNSPGQESVMRHDQEDALRASQSVASAENNNKIDPVDLHNQSDGGSNPEMAELPEANPIDEASVKTGMEAAESSMNEGVNSAQGLAMKEDKDGKSNEVLENNETSNTKEDREATILGEGSEVSSLREESSARAIDLAPTDDHETLQSELAELPQGVLDDLCSAESMNKSADSSEASSSKQPEEVLMVSPIVQESHYKMANEENHQTLETHEVPDLPPDGVELETTGKGDSLDNCELDCKSGTEEEVDIRIGDAASDEPSECTVQQQETFIADKTEPCVEKELPTTGSCIGNISTNDVESRTDPVIKETDLRNEHANSCVAADISIVEQSAADINHSGGVSEMGTLSKQGQECKTVQPPPKEAMEKQEVEDEKNNAVEVLPAEDDMRESNRKLMEENERLRDMMEKLIKSGHEQLTAISSLSGRVKDLEKRLSRKKKLKVKQQFRPSCMAKFDGSGGERRVGVAM